MKSALKKLFSQWFTASIIDSLPIFIACNLAAVLIWWWDISAHTMPLILGIIAAGLSDLDNRLTGRLKNLFFTLMAFSISSLSSQIALSHGWLFIPLVSLIAFAVVMLGAIGNRYRTIAFGSLLVSVYTTLAYMPHIAWYANTLLILLGTLLYGVVAVGVYLLFPNRMMQENVAQYFEALSDYLQLKASLFDPDDAANLPTKQLALARANIHVMAQFDKARVSLFYRLKDQHRHQPTQRLLRYYVAGQDIWERASASHSQYASLFAPFAHLDLVFRLQRILAQQAQECRQIAEAIRNDEPYQPNALGEAMLLGLRASLAFHQQNGVKGLSKIQAIYENLRNIEHQLVQLAQTTVCKNSPKTTRLIAENVTGLGNMWEAVKSQCNFSSQLFRHALRLSIVVFVCSALVEVCHIELGYWILLTAVLVCQPNYAATKKRLVQRVVGTVLGVVIGLSLRYLSPTLEAQLGLIVASSTLFFFFRNSRYSFSTFFITLQVLVSFDVIGLDPDGAMLPRIFDTLIGVGVAWFAVSYLWADWKYIRLHSNLKQSLKDSANYLRHIIAQLQFGYRDQSAYRVARRSAQNSLANLSTAVSTMQNEPRKYAKALQFAPSLLELSYTLLSYISALGALRKNSANLQQAVAFSAWFFPQIRRIALLLDQMAQGNHTTEDFTSIVAELQRYEQEYQQEEYATQLLQQLTLIAQLLPALNDFVKQEKQHHREKQK